MMVEGTFGDLCLNSDVVHRDIRVAALDKKSTGDLMDALGGWMRGVCHS